MDIIYLLLPVALIILVIIIGIFLWAVKSNQFEDMEGPAHRIIMDDNDTEKSDTSDTIDSNSDK